MNLGESWEQGAVVLSWKQISEELSDESCGHGLVLHEFAHQIDAEDGFVNGLPELGEGSSYGRWAEVFTREYDDLRDAGGIVKTYLTVIYTYNSACPCSYELARYSREQLNTPAISHSQRSEATITVEFDPYAEDLLWIEDIVDMCRKIQPAEVLSGIVTRVGEFSMAQQVASEENIGFVEDVLRKFWKGFNDEPRVLDFAIGICHFESLNANFAAGFINKSLKSGVGLS